MIKELVNKIKRKKQMEDSEFVESLHKFSIVDTCVICKKKMSSECNSHVVPQFILRNIAESGKVAYGTSFSNVTINGMNKETGINNAHTFRLICKSCDNSLFKDYEKNENLLNFDKLNVLLRNRILCEMAIKTRLSHISMKYKQMVAKDMVTGGKLAEKERNGEILFGERVDMDDHFEMISKFINNIHYNQNPFHILFNEVLDYKASIATQTIISYNYDLLGNQIFDPYDVRVDNICNFFYLMIFPFKDKTRIMFYIEKEKMNNVNGLIEQFNKLSFEQKLHFLFISLVIHSEQFYLSPSLANRIKKEDAAIRRLYMRTEKDLSYTKKIKDYNKYTNYLLKE